MDAQAWKMLVDGAWVTAWISGVSIALGVVIGLAMALIRMAKIPVVDHILAIWISWARSVPLVTLTLFIFLAAPIFGFSFNRELVAIIALTINTSAFNAEIWRAAVQSFSKDQREACMACGMPRGLMFRRIMLPQMVVASLPGLVNEMSFLLKGSPAVAIIGLVELTRVTNRIAAVTYDPLPPILAAAAIYMVLVSVLIKLQAVAERHATRLAL